MAGTYDVQRIVNTMMTIEYVTPAASLADIEHAYQQICEWERVSDENDPDWESWHETSPRATRPNRSFNDIQQEIMRMWWGRYDHPPSEWPEAYPPETRQLAAEIGVHPAHVDGAVWLQTQNVWDHYQTLVDTPRPQTHWYFSDLDFFIRAVREMGATCVQRYHDAETWRMVWMMTTHFQCTITEGFMLHAVLNNWWWNRDAWASVIQQVGGRTVAHVMRRVPHATPHAVKVVVRVPEAQESPYFVEMAAYLSSAWDTIPTDTIKQILREEPWRTVNPVYRAPLLAGESPQALIADLWEPVDRHTAHRWITETGGTIEPEMFYATRILGIPEREYQHLKGPRGNVEKIVFDWYARKRTDANMTQERPWRLPDGTLIRVSLMAMIDEVRPEHLINGVHTDPDHVFMTIMNTKRRWELGKFHRLPMHTTSFPAWPERTPIPGITQVRSWDRLIEIGNREQHCAGAYAERCARGETFMFEVDLDGSFSLFQISPGGDLIQHRAKGNSEPIDSHRCAVAMWLQHNVDR